MIRPQLAGFEVTGDKISAQRGIMNRIGRTVRQTYESRELQRRRQRINRWLSFAKDYGKEKIVADQLDLLDERAIEWILEKWNKEKTYGNN